MTPLKPLENLRVTGVSAERYPLNTECAHPECKESTVDAHHCFPRSQIHSDSWFVSIIELDEHGVATAGEPFPHVTGLCRAHHDAVEAHEAWIKLEDGVFVWWDRVAEMYGDGPEHSHVAPDEWEQLGQLNPQPGSREGRPKRRRKKGVERERRRTITLRVPAGAAENGAGILDDLQLQVEEKLGHEPPRSPYYTYVDCMSYVLAHADRTDFPDDD